MNDYYIVYKKKILYGPMSKEEAIVKLFEMSTTLKGLRVRSFFSKKDKQAFEESQVSPDSPNETGHGDLS